MSARTDNAASNGPMLAINEATGFRHVKTVKIWQVETETAHEHLNDRSAPVDTEPPPSS
ncbi:MAG: hypothetical protein ABEK03_05285 [Candidatus Bipolaricaulia bacterium]